MGQSHFLMVNSGIQLNKIPVPDLGLVILELFIRGPPSKFQVRNYRVESASQSSVRNQHPKFQISVAESESKTVLDQNRGWMVGMVGMIETVGTDLYILFMYIYVL